MCDNDRSRKGIKRMMKTPIHDFVKSYSESENVRGHMPGHKGKSFLGIEHLDITEVDGADVLYSAKGIICESEENASKLFGTGVTKYSTEGSSLCIRAMLYLTSVYAKQRGKRASILASRNAHKTFVTAAAILGIDVEWIYQGSGIVECGVSAEKLDEILLTMPDKPTAVYITSPDYLGNVADIKGISEVCRKQGVLLLVDNAHGAYLNFLDESKHPIALGADMCCDSAHKTLPVLTGGAYLHVSKTAPKMLSESAQNALSLFASTSPSYLILQSLDLANKYLFEGYDRRLAEFIKKVGELKACLKSKGFVLLGDEPLKITISAKEYGYLGGELEGILLESGIVCEFYDPDYLVLMLTPENSDDDLERICSALGAVPKRERICAAPPVLGKPFERITPHKAIFMPSEEIDAHKALGRVLASATVSCPPAIPVLTCGEVVDEKAIELFKYYSIEKISVIIER